MFVLTLSFNFFSTQTEYPRRAALYRGGIPTQSHVRRKESDNKSSSHCLFQELQNHLVLLKKQKHF